MENIVKNQWRDVVAGGKASGQPGGPWPRQDPGRRHGRHPCRRHDRRDCAGHRDGR